MKTIILSLLSIILGALAVFNISSVILALISGADQSISIHRITFFLLISYGAVYFFKASKLSLKGKHSLKTAIKIMIPTSSVLLASSAIFYLMYIDGVEEYDENYLKDQASLINARLPIMIDDGLEAFLVETNELNLIYHYRFINYYASDLDPVAVNKAISQIVQTNACTNNKMLLLLKNNITVLYKVSGKEKNPLTNISVTGETCK